MRGTSISEMFNNPPSWSVFDPIMADIGDLPDKVDPVEVMEKLSAVLESYEALTRPRHFREKIGGKKSDKHADIFVFSTGHRQRGSMGHRIVRITSDQSLEVMDLDRALDDSEIFKPRAMHTHRERLTRLTHNYADRLQATLGKSLPTLRRVAGNSARWVDDIDFLFTRDASDFCDLKAARIVMADAMLQSIRDLLPDNQNLRNYMLRNLILCLEQFDEKRLAQANAMLVQAAGSLKPEALNILGRNTSTRTVSHYQFLTQDKVPAKVDFRMAIADACPLVLLLDGFKDKVEGSTKESVDATLSRIFHADETRLSFYKGLTEEQVGPAMARRLDLAGYYIESGKAAELPLNTRGDWDRVSVLIDATKSLSEILQRPRDRVFNDCVEDVLVNPDDAFFERIAFDKQFSGLKVFVNRIVAHALAPKIIVEGGLQGIHIPIKDALYMAAEGTLLDSSSLHTIPTRFRDTVHEHNDRMRLINLFMRAVPVPKMIESAFYYDTHRGEYDALLRNLIITNRMAEHGADYPWEPLPVVRMEEDRYTVVPLYSHADILKNSNQTGDELWRLAPRAVIDGTHFVVLRRAGGITDATAVLVEPKDENGHWVVEQVVESQTGWHRNNLEEIFRAYVAMPEFLDTVDMRAIQVRRKRLLTTLSQRARDNERIGMSDVTDLQERVLKLRVLHAWWPEADKFEVDEHGCISTPVIDARIRSLVRAVAPHYRRNTPEMRAQGPA